MSSINQSYKLSYSENKTFVPFPISNYSLSRSTSISVDTSQSAPKVKLTIVNTGTSQSSNPAKKFDRPWTSNEVALSKQLWLPNENTIINTQLDFAEKIM